MPVIEYSDIRFESPSPILEVKPIDNYSHLARLVIDRRGPEILDFAEVSGINLGDLLVREKVLRHVQLQRIRKEEEFARLSSEASYKL